MMMYGDAETTRQSDYKCVLEHYIEHKLLKHGIKLTNAAIPFTDKNNVIFQVTQTLQCVGDELEIDHAQFFARVCEELDSTSESALDVLEDLVVDLFLNEKNWGRIVSFLVLTGNIAFYCASNEDLGEAYVHRIVDWASRYMESNLDSWINENGSWHGCNEYFSREDRQAEQRNNALIVSALAGLILGGIFMMTCKYFI